MESSLNLHDGLNYWPLVTDPSSILSPVPEVEAGGRVGVGLEF